MKIQYLKIKNIRSFKEEEFKFGKCNFITGWNEDCHDGNGVGKTSIIQSILLLLYGSKIVNINLKKFIRTECKSAEIEGVIEIGEDLIEIKRTLKDTGSGTLKVKINNEDSNCPTSKEYQNLLIEYLGEPDQFKKFRLIDNSSGINVLDFSSTQLRKTLMGMCQDKFDNIRQKLLNKKSHYQKYNKDAVLYKHTPSQKRLKILNEAIESFDTSELKKIQDKIKEYHNEKSKVLSNKGGEEKIISIKKAQAYKLNTINTCPTCFQEVDSKYKKDILDQLNKSISEAETKIKDISKKLRIYNDIIDTEEKKKSKIQKQKERLTTLRYKLESRMKQVDYKYTEKDVELIKEAISILDQFASYYITEWINTIEPIVNSYVKQLNMNFQFELNDKNDISILVTRNEEKFEYDQLSNGEKTFVSFIFKIALLLQENQQGLMIADEGFDSLSVENLKRVVQIIEQLPLQLIFVSHNPEIEIGNAKVLYIEKRNGISELRRKNV